MNWTVIATGKPSQSYARDGIAEYTKRMSRFAKVELRYLKQADPALYEKAAGRSFRIILDERGRSLSTLALARNVQEWELRGTKDVSVWIGGADGFTDAVRKDAGLVLRLSAFTMMHELALLVWMEQLYRVYTVNAGLPYHRE